jgi:hypothetical protein
MAPKRAVPLRRENAKQKNALKARGTKPSSLIALKKTIDSFDSDVVYEFLNPHSLFSVAKSE